uniref:Uncharacterized protein n=1 Tax=Rhizophora mucronata TaxID=61149 RepID=A0A2P2MLP1_RHIMU
MTHQRKNYSINTDCIATELYIINLYIENYFEPTSGMQDCKVRL